MRFGPDEPSIDQSHLAESLQLSQTDRKQFPRFHVANDPLSRRREISRASLAPIDRSFLGDSLGDIDAVRLVSKRSEEPQRGLTSFADN